MLAHLKIQVAPDPEQAPEIRRLLGSLLEFDNYRQQTYNSAVQQTADLQQCSATDCRQLNNKDITLKTVHRTVVHTEDCTMQSHMVVMEDCLYIGGRPRYVLLTC